MEPDGYFLAFLAFGVVYFAFLILRKNRFSKLAWVLQVEIVIFTILLGILNYLNEHVFDTGILHGLIGWIFFFAVLITVGIFYLGKPA
ncbi:MAG: hypothetical protein ABWW66_06955 [Archaeoglobaceae archaeon]